MKGLSNGRGRSRGTTVAGTVGKDPVWRSSQPTAEELVAKKASFQKRNEEHVNKFLNDSQGKNPTIFEDVDASDTCTEHSDASKHPPRTRPKRTTAAKIINPYVSDKNKKTAGTKKTTAAKQPS